MKGLILTDLNRMVEEKWGLAVWERLLWEVSPPSGGVYTTVDNYADEEVVSLVAGLSRLVRTPADAVLRTFGAHLLPNLKRLYPLFFEGKEAKSFLASVHGVIHVEVKKLYPDVVLPVIHYEDPAPDRLVMKYRSPRRLCALAEGLIDGAARLFDTPIERTQTKCLLLGDDHCRIELRFGPAGSAGKGAPA